MRSTAALAVLLLLSSIATAQPGGAPPPPPVYSPPPPPPPAYGYGYGQPPPQAALSQEDARLLQRGLISPEAHIGGAAVSFFIGFGSGQAVQGRWTDTGWIFTVGEAASIAALFIGIGNEVEDCFDEYCDEDNDGLIALGLIGLIGFRVWELVDAFAGPASHNRKVRDLHMRLGYPPSGYYSVAPFVAPTRDGGGVAGFTLRF